MSEDPKPSADPARGRFMAIQLMRISGVALVINGLAIINGKVDLPAVAGYFFIAIGVADALVIPAMLARRWKSPLE